jgi:hypothetical protein
MEVEGACVSVLLGSVVVEGWISVVSVVTLGSVCCKTLFPEAPAESAGLAQPAKDDKMSESESKDVK